MKVQSAPQDLADRFHLQVTSTALSSFGHPVSSARLLQVATISVHARDQAAIPILVLVAPRLAAPLQSSIRMEIRKMPYLRDLQLAHPVSEDENFDINILVGADYYWAFVQDRIIRGDGPTAVQSRLGYLLSGPLPQSSTAVTLVHVNFTAIDNQDLDTFWKTKASGISPSTTESDDSLHAV